ncbi:MAG: excinuclease ABC subunit UvrC [Chloroflexi bacterium]|nr:excinuclease ABC subunit UvrC [Chloroflexota bacterium]
MSSDAPPSDPAPGAAGGPDLAARLAAQVRAIPEKPGVYLFHNARGEVIYVGKAASLRSRVRSYFGAPHSLVGKTRRLSAAIAEIDYVTTNTAQEALHLEATLCKQHQPLYNVRLKDDKHYPYLKIDVDEPWPRVYITRSVQRDGGRYFGPYANAKSVRTTLDIVKKLFPWRSCTKTITGTDPRPCLDYYIRRCIAPCTSYCTPEEYRAVIDQVIHFLEGRTDLVLRDLRARMGAASDALQFEEAARIRDQIRAVEKVGESQVIASTRDAEIDVFGLAQDGNEAIVQVLFVRGTKMTGGDSFPLTGTSDETPAAVLSSFLKQFYSDAVATPRLVLTPEPPDDAALLQDWLRAKRGAAVEVRAPVRGEKRRLVAMAADNARESLQMQRVKWMADQGNTRAALAELEEALSLPRPPERIECYDISNIQGTNSVASMVVFRDGQQASKEYRRFQIKRVQGANDFASMAEVLERRFKRLARQRREAREAADGEEAASVAADEPAPEEAERPREGWEALPDLVIVDGGRGQLSAAHDVMRNLGMDDVPLAGLAKRNEELFVVDSKEPIRLDRRSQGLYLVQRVRDEAHRFAITYHRNLRAKQGMRSALDLVPGIGPKRRQALLKRFGGVQAIRDASLEELAAAPGMTQRAAAAVKEHL